MDHDPRVWRDALRVTTGRLTSIVDALDPAQRRGRSYDREWTVAQVLSHLASQSEVFDAYLDAGVNGTEPPDRSTFPAIWSRWDAKDPDHQVGDGLREVAEHMARFDALTDEDLARFRTEFMGMDLDATGVLRLRLSEFALHTWDVEVPFAPEATLESAAVSLLVQTAPAFVARLAKPTPREFRLRTQTTDPVTDLVWDFGDEVRVVDGAEPDGSADGASARLELPAESLLRLLAGRLDAEHTPHSVRVDGIGLDDIRAIFPGY
jgi:uncharacterized protein (TIGR03083 family)